MYAAGTYATRVPDLRAADSIANVIACHPWSRIDRLSPDFAFTFFPGTSTVPLAERVSWAVGNFSNTTSPYREVSPRLGLRRP